MCYILPAGWHMNTAGEIYREQRLSREHGTFCPTEQMFDTGLTIVKKDGTKQKLRRSHIIF